MTANESTGLRRQESIVAGPRVTATTTRTERGEILTEYEVSGRSYRDVDELEAALRGETAWD